MAEAPGTSVASIKPVMKWIAILLAMPGAALPPGRAAGQEASASAPLRHIEAPSRQSAQRPPVRQAPLPGPASGPSAATPLERHATRPAAPTDAEAAPAGGAPTDAELETFAAIYAQLRDAARGFERDVAAARTAEEARSARCKMQRAQQAALRSHGWTAAKFRRIAAAVDGDPALVERTVRLFDESS